MDMDMELLTMTNFEFSCISPIIQMCSKRTVEKNQTNRINVYCELLTFEILVFSQLFQIWKQNWTRHSQYNLIVED